MTVEYRLHCTIVEFDQVTEMSKDVDAKRLPAEPTTKVLAVFDILAGAIQFRHTLESLQFSADRRPSGERD